MATTPRSGPGRPRRRSGSSSAGSSSAGSGRPARAGAARREGTGRLARPHERPLPPSHQSDSAAESAHSAGTNRPTGPARTAADRAASTALGRPTGATSGSPQPQRRVSSFAQGWRRRADKLRRQRGRRVVWAIGAALTTLLLAWLALFSPLFAISTLQVTGSTDAVRAAATRIGQGHEGISVLRVDTGAVEAQIEGDPRVADATVRRGFPRSLVIEVVARVPVLGLEKAKGKVELLDMTGHLIETVADAPEGIPVVAGGDGVADAEGVRTALHALAALPDSVRSRVRALRFDSAGSITFAVGSTRVEWGRDEQAALKARLVQILLTKKPKVIIVSAPATPVTR